jgi:hypothetical protein
MGKPVAWIEHHKGGDNLVWDNPGNGATPLYTSDNVLQLAMQQFDGEHHDWVIERLSALQMSLKGLPTFEEIMAEGDDL